MADTVTSTVTWQDHDPVGSNKLQVLVYNGNSYELVDKQARNQIDVIGSVLDTDSTGIIAKIKKIEDELNGSEAASSWVTRLDSIDTALGNKAGVGITGAQHGIEITAATTGPTLNVTLGTTTLSNNNKTITFTNTSNVISGAQLSDLKTYVDAKDSEKANIITVTTGPSYRGGGINVSIDLSSGSTKPVGVTIDQNTYNPATHNWNNTENVALVKDIASMVDDKINAIPGFSFNGDDTDSGITVSIDTTSNAPVNVSVAGNTYNPATSSWTATSNVATVGEITDMVDNKLDNLLYEDYDETNFVLDIGGHEGNPPQPVVATTTVPPGN